MKNYKEEPTDCPICKSSKHLMAHSFAVEKGTIWREVECYDCIYIWREVFLFAFWEEVE